MRVNTTKFTGYVLIVLALIIIGTVLYRNSVRKHVPIVFSPKTVLSSTWERYKAAYLEPETLRAIDRQRGDITTSEGQSYTLLRAVWLDDHETFDQSWQWTKDNLQFDDGRIFSWLFGRLPNGTYSILTESGGANSASDADTDIALALVFAYARWRDPVYLGDARVIIADIWDKEVVTIRGRPYLAASNIEKSIQDDVILNPSYFAPYAYRIFAELDPRHDWMGLVDTSYEILAASMTSSLDQKESARLPPNWIAIRRSDGSLLHITSADLNTNYSYDALRVPWRLALDWKWNDEPRAVQILGMMGFLDQEWRQNGTLVSEYSHDGRRLIELETPSMYGGSIGVFMARDEDLAKEVYEKKLQSLYNPDTLGWKQPLSYYDDNWAWFGIALYHDLLPNLWEQGSTTGAVSSAW